MTLLEKIANGLMLSKDDAKNYVSTIPRRYKVYTINKRNSEEKRLIAHPSKQVKALQRAFMSGFKANIPIHSSAYAYENEKDIKKNALQHVSNPFLLKMDFRHFFLSIEPRHFIKVMNDHGFELNDEDKFVISHIFFWKRRSNSLLKLSIGAPSSPFISNAVMYFFDEALSIACKDIDVVYTRYADDLTFSTCQSGVLFGVPKMVKNILKANGLSKIKINEKKTVFSSKKFNRHVTGVTLNNEGAVSLGRERKRLLSSKIHHFCNDLLDEEETLKLKGELGFAKFIEPSFVEKMKNKYGVDIITAIQKYNPN